MLRRARTHLAGRGAAGQDLLSFQGLHRPEAAEGENVQLCSQVHAVGKVHYVQSLIVLLTIIEIVDSKPKLKRKR